jgi:serine/threonine protein kinase
MKVLQKSKVI